MAGIGLMFRRFPVALLLIGLLAIGTSESADASPAAMAAAKAAAADAAFAASKAPETMYESNYVADPSPEAQLDGMDAALDMLIQIQPSSETMKAVQAMKAASKAESKVTTSKVAMVEEKTMAPAVDGIYSTSVGPSAEEQEGAMDSVFDMLVQLPEHKHDATAKLKRALEKKEKEVRALKAKIAAKAKTPHHEAKKAPRAHHEDHEDHKHTKDSSVEELEENEMDAADVDEEEQDEEEQADNEPRERSAAQEVEEWSPPPRSVAPRAQPKVVRTVAKKPVIVDSGLDEDPEAAAALAAVNAQTTAPAGATISGGAPAQTTDYGGETTPHKGNILKPDMHVLKPAEVRAEERKDTNRAEGQVLKKEYYKMVDMNNPGAAAARKANAAKGLAAFRRIAGVNTKGRTQVWLLGCSGNAACEDQFDDAS